MPKEKIYTNTIKFKEGGATENTKVNDATILLKQAVQKTNTNTNKKQVNLNFKPNTVAPDATYVNNNIAKQKVANFTKDVQTYGSPVKALLAKANRENTNKGTLSKTQNIDPNDRWILGAANYRGNNPEQVINANKQTQALGALAATAGGVGSIPVVSQALGAGFAAKDKQKYSNGGLLKRADGSYSERGLWDNIRDNRGSNKTPTKQMLEQEKKIKAKYENGGWLDDLNNNKKSQGGWLNSIR